MAKYFIKYVDERHVVQDQKLKATVFLSQ